MSGIVKVITAVVAVLILLGLFVPVIVRWRETAARYQCQEHLRAVGYAAMWLYTETEALKAAGPPRPTENAMFPAGTIPLPGLAPEQRLSWLVSLSPYFSNAANILPFDAKQGFAANDNRPANCQFLRTLICPTLGEKPPADQPAPTHFLALGGIGADGPTLPANHPRAGAFRYDLPTPVKALADGLSHTALMTETARDLGPWAQGGPATLRPLDDQPYFGSGRTFGGRHPGGANVIFADGSIRFLNDKIEPGVFEKLVTIAGGE